ncbi:MAG TPA: hypothetical protein VML75_13470, partial [Kofleriaceae bacterium]|nr:hypothetical protein [Kofleriaceae bacterium]
MLVAIVVAVGVLHTDWGREQVRLEIEQALDERLAGELSIGRVEGSVLGDLVLRDISVRNRAGQVVATLDSLRVDFKLLPLLSQRFEARLVSLQKLEVVDRGELAALWQSPSDEPTAWSVQVDRLEVHEGSYLRLRPDAPPLRVRGIDLDTYVAGSAERVFVGLRRAVATWVDGDARGRDVGVRASGRLSVADDHAIARDVELSLGGSRIRLHSAVARTDGTELAAVFEAVILARGIDRFAPSLQWRAPIDVIGTVARSRADAPVRAWVRGHIGNASVRGTASIAEGSGAADLHLANVRPNAISRLAPPGRLDLELAVKGRGTSLEDLDARATFEASGRLRDVAARSFSGTAAIADGALQAELHARQVRSGEVRADRISIDARGTDVFADDAARIDARVRAQSVRYGDVWARLVTVDAQASGGLSGDGAARATVVVDELRGDAWRAARVQASTELSALSLDADATLHAKAQQVRVGDEAIGTVALDATLRERGTRVRGTLRVGSARAAYRGRIDLAARISQSRAGVRIDLSIPNARLHTRQLTWRGSAAATIGPGSRVGVERLQLASAAGKVEASGTLRGGRRGAVRFQVADLDLARLWDALPASVELPAVRGHVRASGTVSLEPLRLAIEAQGRNLAWTSDMPTIAASIQGRLDPSRLDARVSIAARRLGRARLELDLRPPAQPLSPAAWRKYRPEGLRLMRLTVHEIDLDRAAALGGVDLELEGRLHGVVSVTEGGDDIAADLRLTGARGWSLRRPLDLHLVGGSTQSTTEVGLELIIDRATLATGRLELD